jgi:CubicO group peptidase (beta-lactamase class C family)
MRHHARSLAILLAVAAPSAARADAPRFDPKPVDEVVEKALKAFAAPGCAVVVVKDGEVVYLKGFGVRERGKDDRVTPDTVFPIASCSKAFTATLVAMLADRGKLKWDDKVRDHLAYFRLSDPAADREVTLRDLLCHRTGMPRHDLIWLSAETADPGDLIKRWGRAKSSTSFRSTWEYANVPFTTAGVIAGDYFSGQGWANAVRAQILQPLGMTRSSATWKDGVSAADHATPHYLGLDKSVTAIDWDHIDHAGGAGCVNSTARDMAEWLKFQLSGGKAAGGKRLLAQKALAETHAPQMLVKPEGPTAAFFPPKATRFVSYGLGWFVHDYRGATCVSHGGTLTGFRAQCMLVPEKNVGVFAVCNLRPSYVTEAVAKTALDAALGLPAEDWVASHKAQLALLDVAALGAAKKRDAGRKPDTKPSLPLKEYCGGYDESAYGRSEVVLEGDKLMLRWGKYTFRLDHHHFDTFTAVPVEPKPEVVSFDRAALDLLFRLGTGGEVESMTLLDQEFRRVKPK